MFEQVRPGRAAIVAGVLVAVFVTAMYIVRTVPDGVVSLLGGPEGGVARIGGLRMRYTPAPDTDTRYLGDLVASTEIKRDGDAYVLEFPGVAEELGTELAEILASGGLKMKVALETDYARQIGPTEEVSVEEDHWRTDTGESHENAYLRGPTIESLERAIAAAKTRGWQPAPGTEIAFEYVESFHGDASFPAHWRSYELASKVEVDGSMIADATTSYDPSTNRPIVLLDFTREGGDRFAELTRRIVGKKLATVLGGRIRSAPIIMDEIRGGRASITMGGSDPTGQQREATMLAEVLRKGSLPLIGKVDAIRWSPAPDVTAYEWAGRVLLGVLAGLVMGLVAFVTIKLARPHWGRRPVVPEGGGALPWRRIAVTLVAPIVLVVGSKITLPGIDREELAFVLDSAPTTQFSVLALGVAPILVAFFLVELVALAVPPLRWRRHDPLGRVRLGQAVAALTIVLALAQAFFIALNLEHYGRLGSFGGVFGISDALIVADPGWAFRIGVMASLVTGTLVLAIVAGMIREHGLGNGYGVIFLAGSVIDFLQLYVAAPKVAPEILARDALGLAGIAVIGAITAAVLRWRVAALRVPASGLAPLGESQALFSLFGVVSLLGLGTELSLAMGRVTELQAQLSISFALVIVSVPVWSWLFARPRLVGGTSTKDWLRATGLSLGAIVAIAAIQWMARRTDDSTAALVNAVTVMVGTAVLLDMRDDLRAHRQRLAPVAVVHQVQRLGRMEHVLTEAGIPYHVHSAHLRTLYAFFGPFAPAIVMVPEVHAIEARGKLAESRAEIPVAELRTASAAPAPEA